MSVATGSPAAVSGHGSLGLILHCGSRTVRITLHNVATILSLAYELMSFNVM